MKRFWILLVAMCCHSWIGSPLSLAADLPKQPNVILIFADDLGYGDLACYGSKTNTTPNIDALAEQGTRFTNFLVPQPVCTASRAALMTGCYPNRVGLSGALNHTSPTGINPRETLLPELFQSRGYQTAIYGKWHLGHQRPFVPTRNGFNEFAGIPYSNDNGTLHPIVRGIPRLPWYENEDITEKDPDQAQFTKRLTSKALSFINANKTKPFFLYVPHIMPHVPIFASEEFQGKSGQGIYADVIAELDWSVGQIMKAVEDAGIAEKTLILFTSDNGPFLSYGSHAGSAAPYREGKLTTFEGGLRMPMIARWPTVIPAGQVSDNFLSSIDFYPTLANLIGASLPKTKIDGLNLLPALLNQRDAKSRDVFWYYSGTELQAVRRGKWKLHLPHEYLTVNGPTRTDGKPANYENMKPKAIEESGIRGIASRHGYKVAKMEAALIDLANDPGETTDRSAKHPEIVEDLQKLIIAARNDLCDSAQGIEGKNLRPAGSVRPKVGADVRVISNQTYANRPTGNLLLDLYVPKSDKPVPVVLWVHGGGWVNGTKEPCPAAWLTEHGFAVVSVQYRLVQDSQWPGQMDDLRDAVRWVRSNAEKFGLAEEKIGAWGASAGGHLVALLGTLPVPKDEKVSSRVTAICDWFGPADLLTMPPNVLSPTRTEAQLAKSNGARLLGGPVKDQPEKAKSASALYQVSANDAAFLIMHGDGDKSVPLEQSQRLAAALQKAGVPVQLEVLEGAGHGGKEFSTPEARKRIVAFFGKYLGK